MCLAIPGKIVKVEGSSAIVDFLGEKRQVDISNLNCSSGDFVLVTAGVAMQKLSEEDALKSLKEWKRLVG